jgi:hypothetical protein
VIKISLIRIQTAHAAVKAQDNDLKPTYLREKDAIGYNNAIVSVARKMVIII